MYTLENYQRLTRQALALIEGEINLIANLSNVSALLNMELENINWVGFYLTDSAYLTDNEKLIDNDQLVLGPFQGNPACVRIPMGRGVCGTAAATNSVQRIDDVHRFEGHIACDAASNAELVIPFSINGKLRGVLDIDSPKVGRFSAVDEEGLTFLMNEIEKVLNSHANEG